MGIYIFSNISIGYLNHAGENEKRSLLAPKEASILYCLDRLASIPAQHWGTAVNRPRVLEKTVVVIVTIVLLSPTYINTIN